jgi:hypothetical protein
VTGQEAKKASEMMEKFKTSVPQFAGPVMPEAAVNDVLSVIDSASVTTGSAGAFVSHLGVKRWL